jgi:hypothetical protein
MRTDDIEEPSFLQCAEIERAVDQSIDGLLKMDAEILMQLAHVCRDWEVKELRLSVSNATYARLSWKLLLLDRLLRQTRTNLNVIGLVPRQHLSAEGYRIFVGR